MRLRVAFFGLAILGLIPSASAVEISVNSLAARQALEAQPVNDLATHRLNQAIEQINQKAEGSVVLKLETTTAGEPRIELIPVFGAKGVEVTVRATPSALVREDMVSVALLQLSLVGLATQDNPYPNDAAPRLTVPQWTELEFNARHGSAVAQGRLLEHQMSGVDAQRAISPWTGWKSVYAKELSQSLATAAKARKDLSSRRNKAWQLRKAHWRVNDPAAPDLGAFIRANDRSGVAKILRERLPWELMDHFERRVWSNWVNKIEHPDLGNRILVFRGMMTNETPSSTNSVPLLLSTMLSRNRGSYLDRLRSMGTARERSGLPHPSVGRDAVSFFSMIKSHAGNPNGSPFLSFSNYFNVALRFAASDDGFPIQHGRGTIGAFMIDRDMLMPNLENRVGFEREVLIPLMVFPDELIVMGYDIGMSEADVGQKKFIQEVETKIGRNLRPDELKLPAGRNAIVPEDTDYFRKSVESAGVVGCLSDFVSGL
jgi:hypothetical protein